jgi:hypothetical protein
MLQDELCKHPDIQHVAYSPHTYFETQHWLKAAVLLGMPAETFYGHCVHPDYGSKKNARTYLVDCVKRNVPDFQVPTCDRELVFQGWEALCDRFAKPVFFEKSPHHLAQWAALSLMLQWIQRTEFRVSLIGLVRNPHAVLASASKLFLTDGERRQFAWADMQRNLLAFRAMLPSESFHLVRYEDILADPGESFKQTHEFLRLPLNDRVGMGVRQGEDNKWKTDDEYSVQLHESVKQVARHFGYTEEDLSNPGKRAPSLGQRFHKRLARLASRAKAKVVNGFAKPRQLSRVLGGRSHAGRDNL